MNPVAAAVNAIGGAVLARIGRVGILETTGRRTGEPRRTAIGYVQRPDGRLILGAGGEGRKWALNLATEPRCAYTLRGARRRYRATELTGEERDRAIAELVAKFGRIGGRAQWREVFELVPETEGSR